MTASCCTSMSTNRTRETCSFHTEQSKYAREQYTAQETIAICEQECLTADRAANRADRAHVNRRRALET